MKKRKKQKFICNDALMEIFMFLKPKTLYNLSLVCKQYYNILHASMYMWKKLYQHYWINITDQEMKKMEKLVKNWKDLFQKRYSSKLKYNQLCKKFKPDEIKIEYINSSFLNLKKKFMYDVTYNENKNNVAFNGKSITFTGSHFNDKFGYNKWEKTYHFPLHFCTYVELVKIIKDFDIEDRGRSVHTYEYTDTIFGGIAPANETKYRLLWYTK
jgi:hypothetical protein